MKEKEKENKRIENQITFSFEEKKLLKKYMEEYNDIYQKILLLSKEEFIDKLIKNIEISLRSKIKNFSEQNKNKVKEFLIEKIYESDYKYSQIIRNNIEKRNKYELSKNVFKGEIIPHCEKDKKNGFYIHSCGEKFQVFKYKISYDYYIMHLEKESKTKDINTNHYENILYCIKCKMIYKSSLIKFKCAETGIDFYSKIIISNSNNGEIEDDLPYATWAKYHCNVVINDLMKCQKCSNNLYFLKKTKKNPEKKLICKKCNKMWLPEQIRWECLICKQKFSCDAKAYNPLEFKTLKICVKDALVDKIRAFPKNLDCKCKIDYSKNKFFHRTSCNGELFFGELNGRKTVICNKCDSIGFYDEYIWTCPICFKKTKTIIRENKFEEDKISEKNNFENRSAIHRKKNNEIKKNEEKEKDNISVSKISNDSTYRRRRRRLFNLFRNENTKKNDELNSNKIKNDLKNSVSNNYLRYKSKNNIFEESGNNSLEKRDIKNSKTIEKEESNNNSINKEYNNNNNYLKNQKEEYFRNFRKKYLTNISINSKIKEKNNNNLSKINSEKKDIKNNKEIIDSYNNNNENKILKPKKSLSIIDFEYSNIKDIEKILNKFEKKININLNLKPSGINFHRPSSKQINNKIYSTIENKEKDIKVSKNKTTIEESPVINENNIKRKESFINKYNKFKRSSRISRVPSNKILVNENKNIKNILTESYNNKNNSNKINNLENYCTEANQNLNSLIKNEECISFFRKSKIFQRYKNMKNNNNNINNENKNITKNQKNNEIINKINNNDKSDKKELINDDNYYPKDYHNKKGSNSTAADSEQTTKIIYHNKNPRQSFQIRRTKKLSKNINNFDINEFKIIKKIGQGSFGQIFKIEDKDKNKYAMKKILLTSENDIKKIEHEYQILIDLNNQIENEKSILNLVRIYGYSSKQLDPTTYVIYVLMELAITDWEKEILFRQKSKNYYKEKELMTILYSLIKTFAELQKRKISHRDIKPQNILLFKDNKYKLADFGEAKELYKDIAPTNKQTLRGTELYMAPTLFQALQSKKLIKYVNHNPYKSDVFSFGLCSLLAASLCFESIYDIRELNNNVSIHVILEKYLSKNYSFDVINIISQMLDVNETTRKDFIEIKNEFELIGYK